LTQVAPILALQARAEARAFLYGYGELTLVQAIEPLRQYARDAGLLEQLGAPAVEAIILKPFDLENE
jgi:hypothetical protein